MSNIYKELIILSGSSESYYALEREGYRNGVLDAMNLIKKSFNNNMCDCMKEAIAFKLWIEVGREWHHNTMQQQTHSNEELYRLFKEEQNGPNTTEA